MNLFSDKKVSPINKVNIADLKRIGLNALVLFAPILAIFFKQIADGVDLKVALNTVWIGVCYLLYDFFKKLKNI
jgi:hypothetical protein